MSGHRESNDWPSSLWALARSPFESDPLPTSAHVAIVGAGYSGLWTAIWLKRFQPGCDVVVLEANEPGFGASGRNGGWCSALFPVDLDELASRHGTHQARRMQIAMNETVLDVGRFIAEHDIDCDWERGGTLTIATNPAHEGRLCRQAETFHHHGFGEVELLSLIHI